MGKLFYDEQFNQLYDAGMPWIEELWKGHKIVRKEVLPKTVGRNGGFILVFDVYLQDQTKQIQYYAKIQEFELDMILSHWVLKEMSCGPSRCFFHPIKQSSSYFSHLALGMITEEVEALHLARGLGLTRHGDQVLKQADAFLTDSFLLSIAVQLCQFTRIPDNRDNWGFIGLQQEGSVHGEKTAHRVSIIDFSSYGYAASSGFDSKAAFSQFWANNIHAMISRCSLVDPSKRTYRDWEELVTAALEQQADRFPWLHSKSAFLGMLQRACDQTAECVHQVLSFDMSTTTTTATDALTSEEGPYLYVDIAKMTAEKTFASGKAGLTNPSEELQRAAETYSNQLTRAINHALELMLVRHSLTWDKAVEDAALDAACLAFYRLVGVKNRKEALAIQMSANAARDAAQDASSLQSATAGVVVTAAAVPAESTTLSAVAGGAERGEAAAGQGAPETSPAPAAVSADAPMQQSPESAFDGTVQCADTHVNDPARSATGECAAPDEQPKPLVEIEATASLPVDPVDVPASHHFSCTGATTSAGAAQEPAPETVAVMPERPVAEPEPESALLQPTEPVASPPPPAADTAGETETVAEPATNDNTVGAVKAHSVPSPPPSPLPQPLLVRHLEAYRLLPHPDHRTLPYQLAKLCREYEERVAYMNDQVCRLSGWFPYTGTSYSKNGNGKRFNKRKRQALRAKRAEVTNGEVVTDGAATADV